MKINWFCPLPPAETGVAQYAAAVLPVLCRHAELTLWTDQQNWSRVVETYGRVRRYDRGSLPDAGLDGADLTVYHIGNNSVSHGNTHLVSLRHPGLVVLHDTGLQGLFTGTYLTDWAMPAMQRCYLNEMQRYYGTRGRRAAEAHLEDSSDEDLKSDFVRSYPLTPLALEGAKLALVHTEGARREVAALQMCPTRYAPLPYAPPGRAAAEAPSYRTGDGPVRLAVFGHISPVRRLESLLQALAGLDERARFRLDVYGRLWDTDKVQRQIQALGLASLVSLHGYVPDAALEAALAQTHLAVNLRSPTLGEASYSQLQIWSHALPSFVTRNGWYAELPGDAVAFVRPGPEEIGDIQAHLRAFLSDPAGFAQMGRRGRQALDERHTPEMHVQALLEAAEEVRTPPWSRTPAPDLSQHDPAPGATGRVLNVLCDVSALGESALFAPLSEPGVFLTENLVQSLAADSGCHVKLCAAEFGAAALTQARTCPGLKETPFPYSPQALRLALRYDALEKRLGTVPPWSRPGWRAARKALHVRRQALSGGVHILDPAALRRADIFQTGFAVVPAAVRRAPRVKTFLSVWDMTPVLHREWLTEAEGIRLDRILESLSPRDHALCPSQFVKDELCGLTVLGPDRVFVVPPAADARLFHPVGDAAHLRAVRLRHGIPDGPYLLSADAFGPLRDTEWAVRAFAALLGTRPDPGTSLVLTASKGVVGHPIFRELDPTGGLGGRIVLTGPVVEDDMAALYCGASAFLDLSLRDGVGLHVLEAMLCGTPVIVARAGALPERVGGAGILVDPENADGACQALAGVLADKGRRAELSSLSLARAASMQADPARAALAAYRTAAGI